MTDAAADLATCRTLLRGGSKSFFLAGLLLPRRVLDPATALYAFCRVADDLIDLGTDPDLAVAALEARVDALYAGRPHPHPADRALAHVVAAHRLPRLVFTHLLEGFAWDASRRQYQDLAALHAYAARVAGTVGVAMATLMGARTQALTARACELGMAMQLTNIARDVGEDARAGRLYLPLDWLAQAGVDPAQFLAQPRPSPALGHVVRRLLAEADRLYARADAGIAGLPLDCRPGIAAARRLYAAIGRQVARQGHDSVTRRARLGPLRKGAAALQGLASLLPADRGLSWPPLPAALPLVAPLATSAPPLPAPSRAEWLLTLFGELEMRQARRG